MEGDSSGVQGINCPALADGDNDDQIHHHHHPSTAAAAVVAAAAAVTEAAKAGAVMESALEQPSSSHADQLNGLDPSLSLDDGDDDDDEQQARIADLQRAPLDEGSVQHQSMGDPSQQTVESQSHPQLHPQLQPQQQTHSHHRQLQPPFLQPTTPVSQLSQQAPLQLQTPTADHNHVLEAGNGTVQTMFTPAQPQQNMMSQFQTPPSLQSPQPCANQHEGHFSGLKMIQDPPDLEKWRERLFNVEDTIVLSEDDFQTYFPHVDNVYSHRSTQKYKRKPFISHYWDCRLKGRPPGTPKSHDPNKKKRKRVARERNLCDVKIKITEYFPGALTTPQVVHAELEALSSAQQQQQQQQQHQQQQQGQQQALVAPAHGGIPGCAQPFGVLTPNNAPPADHHGAGGGKYYTIQRVNGNGGNGRPDSVGGPHRHTLEESDRVKKNSVQRSMMKDEKEKKKVMKKQKSYHKEATGYAFSTVKKHSKESDLQLFGSCFCPFVQRVWIALEVKGTPYQYIEVDPYKKPESLLEVNPRGLVPAIRHGSWGCHESTVLLEYLEDTDCGNPLLPPGDPQLRAHCRLWADHINRHIIPCFYRLLQEQDVQKQIGYTEELKDEISKLVNASHVHGPFFLGPSISFVDIQFAPWMLRLSRVLKPYRAWPDPETGSRWAAWVEAVETNEQVMATTSSDELYLDSYQRYADNRPDTSMLAKAINSGRPLP